MRGNRGDGQSRGRSLPDHGDSTMLIADESAIQAIDEACLKVIVTELVTKVRQNVTIDWNLRERRPGQDPGLGETDFEPLRLSARFAGGSGEDRASAGGAAVCGVGVRKADI